jgi:hypothetical protein
LLLLLVGVCLHLLWIIDLHLLLKLRQLLGVWLLDLLLLLLLLGCHRLLRCIFSILLLERLRLQRVWWLCLVMTLRGPLLLFVLSFLLRCLLLQLRQILLLCWLLHWLLRQSQRRRCAAAESGQLHRSVWNRLLVLVIRPCLC